MPATKPVVKKVTKKPVAKKPVKKVTKKPVVKKVTKKPVVKKVTKKPVKKVTKKPVVKKVTKKPVKKLRNIITEKVLKKYYKNQTYSLDKINHWMRDFSEKQKTVVSKITKDLSKKLHFTVVVVPMLAELKDGQVLFWSEFPWDVAEFKIGSDFVQKDFIIVELKVGLDDRMRDEIYISHNVTKDDLKKVVHELNELGIKSKWNGDIRKKIMVLVD
jgi:hypothetical protein